MCQILLLSFRSTGPLWFQKPDSLHFLLPPGGTERQTHRGAERAPFNGSGSNHPPFSSSPPLDSVQLVLIYTPDYHSRLHPSVPCNHFRLRCPHNSSSWPDTVAMLLASQEGFFIEHHLNWFYLFLTTCCILPPPSFYSLTKAKCLA